MIVTCVHIKVKKENLKDFIQATMENHHKSVHEPGNLRFDFIQSMNDPTVFMLYEAYESEESAAQHKKTQHYLNWRETVADWMEKPREGKPYRFLAPDQPGDF